MNLGPGRPNIVLVLTDDQGYPTTGRTGHPFLKTPEMDKLYDHSARFTQFHTGPTCAPTRAGLLTGHYANAAGVWNTVGGRSLLRSSEWTLANALQENGWHTALFGKWHLGDEPPYRPFERGFETTVCLGGGGIGQTPDYWRNDYFNDTYLVNGHPRKFQGYCTDIFFNEAIRFIETHRDEPFFCMIACNAPHAPYNVARRYWEPLRMLTDSEDYARFLGMIENIDENLGKLNRRLDELGLTDNTILVFMSDNGQCGYAVRDEANPYNAGMRGFKGSEYEGGHRAPFFLRYPAGGITGGFDIDEVTSYVDFMPTILDLAGISTEESAFHGESLVPLLKQNGGSHWKERITFTDSQRLMTPLKWRKSCVLKDTWRLVNRDELYNLADDPAEEINVALQYPGTVAELRQAYDEWWKMISTNYNDPIPINTGMTLNETTLMTIHDARAEVSRIAWNQRLIRRGISVSGHWEVRFCKPGTYRIEARRWPRESRLGLCEEGDSLPFEKNGTTADRYDWYSGGKALDIRMAALRISGLPEQTLSIQEPAAAAVFEADVPSGTREVSVIFSDCGDWVSTAYYLYISRIDSE